MLSLIQLSHNWYRDKNGLDMYYKDGFSASQLSQKIESHLWDDYRYYLFIKKCVQNFWNN